ncbi:PAS domain S-box protein [bacterium]|nr:MAG: PAS domain S-box protein [bacterium]
MLFVSEAMTDGAQPDANADRGALLAEIERLRWLVEANSQVPWEADAEGNITDFSQRWLDLTGLTREQALGGGWMQVPHPDDLPAMAEAWTRAVAAGELYDIEHRIKLANGEYRWMRSRAIPRRDADGRVLAWYGFTEEIHDRRIAEQAMRESEARYRATFESAAVGIAQVSVEGELLRVNDAACEIFGYAREELLGKSVAELSHPDDLSADLVQAERVLNGEIDRYRLQKRLMRKGGGTAWVDLSVALVHGEGGEPRYFVSAFEDITARFVAEEAARRSGEAFQRLVTNSPLGVYAVDADFRLAFVSQGAQKVFENVRPLLGRDFEEVLRTVWEEPFASEAIALFRRVLETGVPYHSTSTVEQRADLGETEAYDWKIERLAMPDGRLGVVCNFYDLSERQRYEAALRVSEERFRAAIGAIGVLWTNSSEGRMEGEQPGWASLTGQSREEYEGYGWASAVHPDDAQPTIDAWNKAVQSRSMFEFEHRVRGKDGQWGRYAIRAVPIVNDRGDVREWVGVHLDLTGLREAERALRELNETLERRVEQRTEELMRANRDLDQFAYSVAHDLRAPLRAIVSTSRILVEDARDRLTDEEVGLLDRQASSSVRLARIVDDLLGFARLSNARPNRQDLDMTAIARSVAAEVTARWGRCEVDVQEGMRASGDPNLIGYALTNLIDNACKFSPEDGRVTVGKEDGEFFVRDEGVGFDMAHSDRLFVAFERLVGQDDFEGTGVGLANVKRIVERHDGRVWAESEPGKGATFWFTLG